MAATVLQHPPAAQLSALHLQIDSQQYHQSGAPSSTTMHPFHLLEAAQQQQVQPVIGLHPGSLSQRGFSMNGMPQGVRRSCSIVDGTWGLFHERTPFTSSAPPAHRVP
ncbi:MAG: hypothetical protein WDW36_002234 [Sanguina aurantia]